MSLSPYSMKRIMINIFIYCSKKIKNKTEDWALVQNAALVICIKVLKLGLIW